MIKLNHKKLSTVDGHKAIVASIRLEAKLGNQIVFTADPSFKQLWQTDLPSFPYSDELVSILLLQSPTLWDTRSAVNEYLRTNAARVRSVETTQVMMRENSGLVRRLAKVCPPLQLTDAMAGMESETLINCLGSFRGNSWDDETKKPVKVPASFISYAVARADNIHALRNAMMSALPIVKEHYPGMVRCLIHHLNKNLTRIMESGSTDMSTAMSALEEYLQKPVVNGRTLSVTMHDPRRVTLKDLGGSDD